MNKVQYFYLYAVVLVVTSSFAMEQTQEPIKELINVKIKELKKYSDTVHSIECLITNLETPGEIIKPEDLTKVRKSPIVVSLHAQNKKSAQRIINQSWQYLSYYKMRNHVLPVVSAWLINQSLAIECVEVKVIATILSMLSAGVCFMGLAIIDELESDKEMDREYSLVSSPLEIKPGQTKLAEIYFDPTYAVGLPVKLLVNGELHKLHIPKSE